MDGGGSAHRSSNFGNLTTEEVTSRIILVSIIVIFLAVLFVLLLHIYSKLYWWRVDQQLQQQQQSPSSPPPSITRHQRRRFIFLSRQGGFSNTGLTASDLSSLPIIVFRQDTCKDGVECAVCLSDLVNGDKARMLPVCSHSFHVECIDIWFQSHATCPICRNTLLIPEQACSKQVEPDPDIVVSTSVSGSSPDHSNFPTNVLVWGSQDQVSTGINGLGPQEESASNSQEAFVLEINDSSSSANTSQHMPSSSSMRFNVEEEEAKSPMTTRLRSLKRFLSRDKRVACSGGSSSNAAASIDP